MNDKNLLLDLEKKGLAALREKKYQQAALLFEKITKISPDYEHGMCFYDLACSLEEIGEIKKARDAYEKAISYAPDDPLRIGAYASFLYLHGNAHEAFETYLSLLRIYKNENDNDGVSSCHQALYSLGSKMGWSNEQVLNAIANS